MNPKAEQLATELIGEIADALDAALGIRTEVKMNAFGQPEGRVTQGLKKDNTRLLELYKIPVHKSAIDMFVAHAKSPKKTREQLGLPK